MKDKPQRLYLHIGTHKTGSSSLQHYLGSIRSELLQRDFAYFEGKYEADNHVELFATVMRQDRESFSRKKYGIQGNSIEIIDTAKTFSDFRTKHSSKILIASSEGLSLLRHDDEITQLKTMIDSNSTDVIPIVVLRDRGDFLESFRKQILKHPDRELSNNPASINYIKDDSWLADYEEICDVWNRNFGGSALRVIDYDAAMQREGDVLPAILRAMNLPEELIPKPGSIRINRDTWKTKIKRAIRLVGLRP